MINLAGQKTSVAVAAAAAAGQVPLISSWSKLPGKWENAAKKKGCDSERQWSERVRVDGCYALRNF